MTSSTTCTTTNGAPRVADTSRRGSALAAAELEHIAAALADLALPAADYAAESDHGYAAGLDEAAAILRSRARRLDAMPESDSTVRPSQ